MHIFCRFTPSFAGRQMKGRLRERERERKRKREKEKERERERILLDIFEINIFLLRIVGRHWDCYYGMGYHVAKNFSIASQFSFESMFKSSV